MHEIVTPARLTAVGLTGIVVLAVAGQVLAAGAPPGAASGTVQVVSPDYQPGFVPFGALCVGLGLALGSMLSADTEAEP